MPSWSSLSVKHTTASDNVDWWRPFLVSDSDGFIVLLEDWTVGGGEEEADTIAAFSLAAAIGGAASLALVQRLFEHAARYAQAQAEEPKMCGCGCIGFIRCSCSLGCSARYYDLKQAILQTIAYALHIFVILACVSFNVWIIFGCCGGVLGGEMLFTWFKLRRTSRPGKGGSAVRYQPVNNDPDQQEMDNLNNADGAHDDEEDPG